MDLGNLFKRAIVVLGLALGCLVPVSSAAAKSGSGRPLVLDAYSPVQQGFTQPVSSRSKLARKHLYVATVRGSVSFYQAVDYVALQAPWHVMCGASGRAPMFGSVGGSGRVGNDAEFILSLPVTGHNCRHTKLPRSYSNFQANLGRRWKHPGVLGRHAALKPSPSHTYEFALTGAGKPVSFRLVDPDTRDDYGSFRIYLRSAVPGDCAGAGSAAFGLGHNACLAATAKNPSPPRLPAVPKVSPIDQGPVARVLRNSDVAAPNQEVPSGALTASQFTTLDNPSSSAARAESKLLRAHGFHSAAISLFAAPGQPTLRSTAVKLGSAGQALAALQAEVALAATAQAPAGTTVTTGPDSKFAHGYIITFTPSAGSFGGLELLASAGSYLYALRAVANPDTVSPSTEEQLLGAVIARG